ncbi:MAG: outer membrane beta-barrel protein, partial [Fluviicola sp.]|nr:outer membrane beta-barrel protein [Fluviicola sp.]
RGKVMEGGTGEAVLSAQVELIPLGKKTVSDLDGMYEFTELAGGSYSLKVFSAEFPTRTIEGIELKSGQVLEVNLLMSNEDSIGEVVIIAKRNEASDVGVTLIQKEANAMMDIVSSAAIARTPAKTTGDVIKLSSGASIQENKFAIIRGLNDRYNAAFLNGSPLPSSESDRKAFSFDIFPSNMLENLIISKTATPDMPAEFAGGIIQINTKSIPDKNFFSFSTGLGYNTITTFKKQTTYKGGKLDWLGVDDGTRTIPEAIPAYGSYPTSITDQARLAQQFSTNWSSVDKMTSPNYNLQFSTGFRKKIKTSEFGMISAFTYNRSFNYTETIRRGYSNVAGSSSTSQMDYDYLDKNNVEQVLTGLLMNFALKINKNNNISFKNIYSINSDDKFIGRTGVINPLESNPALLRSNARWFTSNNVYSSQLNGDHLLKGEKIRINWIASYSNVKRIIPSLNRSSYTRFTTFIDPSNPNSLDTTYTANISFTSVGPAYGGGMFFSENKENSYNGRIDATFNIKDTKKLETDIKVGVYTQYRNREFVARQLGYTKYGVIGGNITFNDSLLLLPEDQIFAPENMGLIQAPSGGSNGVGGFKLTDGTKFSDAYQANSALNAAYVQLDNKFFNFHVIYGARLESFNQQLNAIKDDNSPLEINTTKLDVLPSINVVYALNQKNNIRGSFSQTLNRPEYRELAPFAFFDFTTNLVVSGNANLERAKIDNYDLRFESYPGKGQLLTATVFYKKFDNPIEQVSRADVVGEISFMNVPTAQNFGLELEARSQLGSLFKADSNSFFNHLMVYGNVAVIRSSVDVSTVVGSASDSRPLQGQSPYVFNAGIQYMHPELKLGASLNLNRVGERIAIVGNVNEPDLWENARTFIDFQITKQFWQDRAEFKINFQNILAQDQTFYQNNVLTENANGFNAFVNTIFIGNKNNKNGFQEGVDDQVWRTRFGRTISASISIKL